MPYLTEEALIGLKSYVYKAGGYTWLDNLHTPFWNCMSNSSSTEATETINAGLVQQLPFWLAPNLITLMGLIPVVLTDILILWYNFDFDGDPPFAKLLK